MSNENNTYLPSDCKVIMYGPDIPDEGGQTAPPSYKYWITPNTDDNETLKLVLAEIEILKAKVDLLTEKINRLLDRKKKCQKRKK